MNDLINIVSTLGFPIAVSIACFYYLIKYVTKHNDRTFTEISNITEAVKETNEKLIELNAMLKTLLYECKK